MKQVEPEFGRIFSVPTMSAILNLNESDLDAGFPVQDVSTGFYAIIVPVKTMHDLRAAAAKLKPYSPVAVQIERRGRLMFTAFEME